MDAPLSQGQVILGKYRLERPIGKGAMGVVYAARHIQLDDRVAIKVLLPEMLAEPGVQERFLREAKAARRLKSEHIARVIDVGELPQGTPYIIMEYLEGKDLAKIRSERGALEVEEVVDYVIQACDAIAEAHALGIIHRDIKPANLFLTRRADGSALIKVLDFGTSKMPPKEADPTLEMTHTGMAIGSPSYMAPEQMLSSRSSDARADIWALGVVLYNLLTGKFPFRADTLLQMCAAVIQSSPIPPSTHRGDLPPALEAVILKCLQKKPDDRFSDAAALARSLLPFATAETRYIVERIERVLGVTSDLAPFLAPSIRGSQISPAEASAAGAKRAPMGSMKRLDGDGPSKDVIAPKALTTTSLSTLVRSGRSSEPDVAEAGDRPTKRPSRALVMGAVAALVACAGVAFLGTRPKLDPGEASAAVRPLDTAAAITTPPADATHEPTAKTTGRSTRNGGADPGARAAGMDASESAADAGAPLAKDPGDPADPPSRGSQAAQAAEEKRPHRARAPSSGATARRAEPARSAEPKAPEPISPIIPDDR